MLKTCFRRREQYVRTMVLSLISIQLIGNLSHGGENTVSYLFTKDRFNWSEDQVLAAKCRNSSKNVT